MVSEAPGEMMVRPLPLIAPADHLEAPWITSLPVPVSVDPLTGEPKVNWPQSVSLLRVTATLLVMVTLSFRLGTTLGRQFEATCQEPETAFVQVMFVEPICVRTTSLPVPPA